MLARSATPTSDHREPIRIALLGLAVAATVAILATADPPAVPMQTDPRPLSTASTLEAFASGGASSDALGVRVAADGRFALRAEVMDALHSTVRVSLGGQAHELDIAGARIVGLYRGAHDLTTLQGARVLILGRCAGDGQRSLRECSAESVEVQFAPSRHSTPMDRAAAA